MRDPACARLRAHGEAARHEDRHGALLAPLRPAVWLVVGNGYRTGGGIEHVLPDLAALGRFDDELRSRVGIDDVGGIRGLVRLHARLQGALDAIMDEELERARAETRALVDRFEAIARTVEDLRRLKILVGT